MTASAHGCSLRVLAQTYQEVLTNPECKSGFVGLGAIRAAEYAHMQATRWCLRRRVQENGHAISFDQFSRSESDASIR